MKPNDKEVLLIPHHLYLTENDGLVTRAYAEENGIPVYLPAYVLQYTRGIWDSEQECLVVCPNNFICSTLEEQWAHSDNQYYGVKYYNGGTEIDPL